MHATSRLTAVPQVYGGGVSFVVHPHLWSLNSFNGASSASAGDTIVSELSAVFSNCNFTSCSAASITNRSAYGAYYQLCALLLLSCTVTLSQTLDRRQQQHSLDRIGLRCKARSATFLARM
jgi:hypothetical protein